MKIKYKTVRQAQPGVEGGGNYKYYARICKRQKVSFEQVCDMISDASTFSPADIKGAVTAFLEIIPDYLKQGYIVDLGEFGTFSQSISSDPVEMEENMTSKRITSLKPHFRPSDNFKKRLKGASFKKVND